MRSSANVICTNEYPSKIYDEHSQNDEDVPKPDIHYKDQSFTVAHWEKDWPTVDEHPKSSFDKTFKKTQKFGQIRKIISTKSFMILPVNSRHTYVLMKTIMFVRI